MAAVIASAAAFFAAGGSVQTFSVKEAPAPVVEDEPMSGPQVIAAGPDRLAAMSFAGPSEGAVPREMPASRWRVVEKAAIPRALGPGIAPEQGLQVKTILVARNVSVVFPEIGEIGGVRPDALRWHPNGLALDVMIPNPTSAEGIALGNQVAAYALQNAERFGVQDVIWRGIYYTPNGPQGSGNGHFDHVHITTTGGGYPSGGEVYYR